MYEVVPRMSHKTMMRKSLFLFLFLLSSMTDARAQWEKLPLYGGHAEKLVRSIFNPNEFFALTKSAGVWYSSDAGNNWKPINGKDNVLVGKSVLDLVILKSCNIFLFNKEGLVKSTDFGTTWVIQPVPRQDLAVNVDSKLYVCQDGSLFATYFNKLNRMECLIKTNDGGLTWEDISPPKDIGHGYINYYVDADNSSFIFESAYYGTFAKTTDQGIHWTYPDEFLGNFLN